ncbi:MAG TPA: LUD domain-containing protein [Candidatus Odoribacter faecigallinarum]|jgi:L-lactate dehydrogenase complex protein LldG|uniref:LUD domain-containing protein n=1 Tax=Candidatus Odoribacter faecigallinarum TaxID=2838706 RepID=A0A9D1UZZ5_9BACT|nr:LUD domain-containing protein [Candidatus Odoribacter faecigallinarum]
MSSKEDILARLRKHAIEPVKRPEMTFEPLAYEHPLEQFEKILQVAGASSVRLEAGQDVNEVIRSLYPEARSIASNLPGITCATVNPDLLEDPRELDGTDVAVIRGEFGVLENGMVWVKQQTRYKAVFFISEALVILLDRRRLVNNMHEAYAQPGFDDFGYGCFIAGPSKTADIEQALVIGAHGARAVTVILE